MPGAYLVSAANDMYRIVSADGERTPEQVAKVATLAADALKRVQDDQDFRRAMHESSQARQRNADMFQSALVDYSTSPEQRDVFLEVERAVLNTAGLERGLVDELIVQGREFVGSARKWEGDQSEVLERVDQMQVRASRLSVQLTESQRIAKALDQAMGLNDHLATQLEHAHADNRTLMEELSISRQENQRLAGQLAAAQQTNQDLTNQWANTGPHGTLLGRKRIFWRLTFGVGGLVMVFANTAATPLIGPPFSATSCALGSAFVGAAAA